MWHRWFCEQNEQKRKMVTRDSHIAAASAWRGMIVHVQPQAVHTRGPIGSINVVRRRAEGLRTRISL
jgi:hypothetical protein